jgi:serine/threonine protein phosphatase PrpC
VTLALHFAARSHTGLLRTGNEDSVYAGPRLLAVADGMGGHAAGEVASAVAIAAMAPLDEDAPGADLLEALREAAMRANEHLADMVNGDPSLDGMGTTLTAILSAGNRLGLLHVGDSRCYLLRAGELSQITHDHTLVQSLVDEGRISEQEASTHPQRSMITRALDGRRALELDLSVREVRADDRYLLCSDGLTGPVGSLETLKAALSLPDPQDAVDRLVQLALRGGGPDNVTVIVAEAVETGAGGRTSSPVVAGAAAESPQAPPPGVADSAASRARTAEGRDTQPGASTSIAAGRRSRRPSRRTMVVLAVVLLLVLGGAGAGWAYVRSQYYVGLDGGSVAVFRGVRGDVAGLSLSSVAGHTDLTASRLSELDRDRVADGIPAADQPDARRIVARLQSASFCQTPATGSAGPASPAASPVPVRGVPRAGSSPQPTPSACSSTVGGAP